MTTYVDQDAIFKQVNQPEKLTDKEKKESLSFIKVLTNSIQGNYPYKFLMESVDHLKQKLFGKK